MNTLNFGYFNLFYKMLKKIFFILVSENKLSKRNKKA
jgi:hypothetical protein